MENIFPVSWRFSLERLIFNLRTVITKALKTMVFSDQLHSCILISEGNEIQQQYSVKMECAYTLGVGVYHKIRLLVNEKGD